MRLIIVVCLTAYACAGDGFSPFEVSQSSRMATMESSAESTPPVFSEAELRRAFAMAGMDPAQADSMVKVILEVQKDSEDFVLTDETLFFLVLVSDDVAARVVQFNPTLADAVAELRRNPESLQRLIAERKGDDGG